MRIIYLGSLLAFACNAQIAFVPSRPGNWVPTTPIFGVRYGAAGDTINYRSIQNLGPSPIVIQAASMEIRSPGLEGEWQGAFSIEGAGRANFSAQKVSFKTFRYSQINPPSIASQATAYLSVSQLVDCEWPCTVDKSVTPPDTLFKHNKVNPVDTFDVRLGVYWRVQGTDTYDSAYLDCKVEYRTGMHTEGVRTRFGSVQRPPVNSANGWLVDGNDGWSLRLADGDGVDLVRTSNAQGLLLQPIRQFTGIGILSNSLGDSYRVVGTR